MSNDLPSSDSYYGTIHFGPYQELTGPLLSLPLGCETRLLSWRPPEFLCNQMRSEFQLDMIEVTDAAGMRRYVPSGGYDTFIKDGYEGGLALLNHLNSMTNEHRGSYRGRWLLFQWLRLRDEHLNRKFSRAADLFICRSGRSQGDEFTILPEDLGLIPGQQSEPWTVNQLMENGTASALRAGIMSVPSQDAISYGMMEAALRNPLRLEANCISPLMRMGLYAQSYEPAVTTEIKEEVYARFIDAVEQHQLDSQEDFNRWCWEGRSNLPSSLADRTTTTSGRLTRSVVKQALIDLGWGAYQYIAQCIHVMTRRLGNCIRPTLSPQEQILFDKMYACQAIFGGLPLVMFMERSSIIRPIITRMWNEPHNVELVGALHRVLYWYGEMVGSRRAADRRRHQRAMPCGPAAIEVTLSQNADLVAHFSQDSENNRLLEGLRDALLERFSQQLNARCQLCQRSLNLVMCSEHFSQGEPLRLEGSCTCNPERRRFSMAWTDVLTIAAELDTEGQGQMGNN